jgi:hypothetical protein
MAAFDFVDWGNTKIVGHWVLEGSPSPSGVYRGQCTQAVTQFLKDFGYSGWNAARGNGNQVGATMVSRGEAVYVGTNLSSIPAGEVHVICKDVGNPATDGHVSVAAAGDTVYEQNVTIAGSPVHNYGIGNTYPGRLGRLSEAWRGTRYHYKIIVEGGFDDIGGDGGSGDPGDGGSGPNQNRYFSKNETDIKKKHVNDIEAARTHKNYQPVKSFRRNVGN